MSDLRIVPNPKIQSAIAEIRDYEGTHPLIDWEAKMQETVAFSIGRLVELMKLRIAGLPTPDDWWETDREEFDGRLRGEHERG